MPRTIKGIREIRPSGLSWSGDGRFLLADGNDLRNRHDVFRIDIKTGAVTRFPGAAKRLTAPRWSRDAARFFWRDFDPYDRSKDRVLVRSLKTGRDRELHRGREVGDHLALSPDERRLAFYERDPAKQEITLRLIPVAGGPAREVGRVKETAESAARWSMPIAGLWWTQDGRHLRFLWQPEKSTELWQVPAAGGAPLRLGVLLQHERDLPPHSGTPEEFSLHPDGRQIAFATVATLSEVWVMENLLRTVQTASAAASRP